MSSTSSTPDDEEGGETHRHPERLPANNPHIGTFHHSGILYPTYMYYAAHSPYLPFLRHSEPTTPIAQLVYNMMCAQQGGYRQDCGEDWVVVPETETGGTNPKE